MYLPIELGDQIRRDGSGEPQAAVRGLYDIDGNLGESYAVASDRWLTLFSKRVGQPFSSRRLAMEEIDELTIQDDRAFLYLQIKAAGQTFQLKFSTWDRADLEQITALWSEHSGRLAVEGEAHLKTTASSTSAPETLDALTAFCASVHALIQADGHADQVELNILQQAVPDPSLIEQGRRHLERTGVEGLLPQLKAVLNPSQRLCLLANLIEVAMADGVLRSKEQRLLERFQAALEISEPDYQAVFNTLRIGHQLAVFADEGPRSAEHELNPLAAFVAALHAMVQADGAADPKEQAILWHLVDDPVASHQGMNFLATHGSEALLNRLNILLTPSQKLCLLANLIKAAMIDGVLRSAEQRLLDRFREALAISDRDYQAIFDVQMLKNNLSVFALPEGSR